MSALAGFKNFNPDIDIPALDEKVVFVTGGTSGLGRASILALAKHTPAHIYFTGRNAQAAETLIAEVHESSKKEGGNKDNVPGMTFLELDMASLSSVKAAVGRFAHSRLDILLCNAGIMSMPPTLSRDGFELQFAVNHLAHAMIIQQLLPTMLATAALPLSDVRVVCLSSEGWRGHPWAGFSFDQLRTPMDAMLGSWIRYGQSKLANIVYARELALRYPHLTVVSIHPGVVETGLVTDLRGAKKALVYLSTWVQGMSLLTPQQGCLNQVWAAAGAKSSELVNGAYYLPVGVLANSRLDSMATNPEMATKLWDWTEDALRSVD